MSTVDDELQIRNLIAEGRAVALGRALSSKLQHIAQTSVDLVLLLDRYAPDDLAQT